MKSRRELKALLLASVATLSLMSGCSKNSSEAGCGYYVEKEGELIEIDNIKNYISYASGTIKLILEDGSYMIVPAVDFYRVDKNSESQQEFIRKLTK